MSKKSAGGKVEERSTFLITFFVSWQHPFDSFFSLSY